MKLLISCEHADNTIPKEYLSLFKGSQRVLNTHLGYDIGALGIAKFLRKQADFHLFAQQSRLLIDLNRSLHHQNVFSIFSNKLHEEKKEDIINQYYLPYRKKVTEKISEWIQQKETVLHLSIHSFTPVLNGIKRTGDIGLLYDPRHKNEKKFAADWKKILGTLNPQLKIRMNYPYQGRADGFCTALREQFTKNYIGIELEINQAYLGKLKNTPLLKKMLVESLLTVLG